MCKNNEGYDKIMPSIALIFIAIFFMFVMMYLLSELMFITDIVWSSAWLNDGVWDEKIGDCYFGTSNSSNNHVTMCKGDFGLMGWKQWTSDSEEELIEKSLLKIVNPSPNKMIIVPANTSLQYSIDG